MRSEQSAETMAGRKLKEAEREEEDEEEEEQEEAAGRCRVSGSRAAQSGIWIV